MLCSTDIFMSSQSSRILSIAISFLIFLSTDIHVCSQVVVTLEICHCPYDSHDQIYYVSLLSLLTCNKSTMSFPIDSSFSMSTFLLLSFLVPSYSTNLSRHRHFKHSQLPLVMFFYSPRLGVIQDD